MPKVKFVDLGKQYLSIRQEILDKFDEISKNGDYYIDLFLRDKTGQINAKIWHFCDFYDLMFNEGDLVAVKGIVKNYRKKLFLEIINNLKQISPHLQQSDNIDLHLNF